MATIETVTALPSLPPRPADSNKGSFGRILIIAGSRGMSGAAVLCASAALRGGAGLVKAAVPAEIQPIVAVGQPCCIDRRAATRRRRAHLGAGVAVVAEPGGERMMSSPSGRAWIAAPN